MAIGEKAGAFPNGKQCALPGCRTEEWRFEKKMCLSHHFQWKRLKRQGITFEQFTSTQRPINSQWSTTDFTLADLPPILRHEFLLTLQQRDHDGYRLVPWVIHRCITVALENRALAIEKLHRIMKESETSQRLQQGFTNYGRMWSARWRHQYTGHDMKSEDIWDAAVLMLRALRGLLPMHEERSSSMPLKD